MFVGVTRLLECARIRSDGDMDLLKAQEDDYYKLLGCDESSTVEQIEVEYKQLARKFHPDKATGPDAIELAEKNFVKLEKAKSVLLDEELRKKYDQWRSSKLHISFEQWLSMSSMMHSSLHWKTKKDPPALPQTEAEASRESVHAAASVTHSMSLQDFRTGSNTSGALLSQFRSYKL